MNVKAIMLFISFLSIFGCSKPEKKYVLSHVFKVEVYNDFLSTEDIRIAAEKISDKNPQYDSVYVTRLPADTITHKYSVIGSVKDIETTVLFFHFCSPKKNSNSNIEIEYDSCRKQDYLLGAY